VRAPQPFHLTRTENPRLAVRPWNVTATLPAQTHLALATGSRAGPVCGNVTRKQRRSAPAGGKVADGANATRSLRPCRDQSLRSPFRRPRPGCACAHGVWGDASERQASTGNSGRPKLARKREAVYPALATRGDPCRPALRQSGWLDLDEVPLVGGPRSAQTSQNWRPATRRPGPPTSRAGQLGRGSGLSRIVLGIRSHVSASRLLAGHRPRRQGAADVRDACPQGVWLAQLGSRTSLAWASVRECSPGPAAHRAADSPGQRETGGPIAQTAIRAP
jgi:hypothetical protein